MNEWYGACASVADRLAGEIDPRYISRSFAGLLGDIKALPSRKSLSLYRRKPGLGLQYAHRYCSDGVDYGKGYQACAAEALAAVTGYPGCGCIGGRILDVGCAIGVVGGVLGIGGITGFDLFTELLETARMIDELTGRTNRYVTADMTGGWPFASHSFDTVICALVCHHLKTQEDVVGFFRSANRCCAAGGHLVVTLPAGTVSGAARFASLCEGVEAMGFSVDSRFSGLAASTDSARSQFWMFLITARKTGAPGPCFISPEFAFPAYRTPVSRVEKGARVRASLGSERSVKHHAFALIHSREWSDLFGDAPLTYETVVRGVGRLHGGQDGR